MPNEPTQDADKLRKLGQRVRDGFAKGHPVPEKSLETVRDAVRKEWEKERANEPQRPPPESERER
jgi:hypothetical protein